MFEAKFKLRHKGCWTNGLAKFQSKFVTHNTVSLNEGFVQDITEVILKDKAEAKEIKRYFLSHKIIKKAAVLEERDGKIVIQVFTDTRKIHSVVHQVLLNKCFLAKRVPIVQGWEVWTIAAPKKHALNNAIKQIRKLGEFKLLHVSKSTFDGFGLSKKQEDILRLAVECGYYDCPRRITAQELSRKLGLSKATVSEHLRKAQNKIVLRDFGI